jgi:hypothetical protein
MRYPTLPEGMKQRNLPMIDPLVRPGKNAYWIALNNLKNTSWQEFLPEVLSKIDHYTSR